MNELVKANLYLIHMDDELYHHGIKGMKWGVRRYQNPDGSLTEEGKKRKRRRLIAAGVIIAGAAALTIGAIAGGKAARKLNAGRKIMANENVCNTAVSEIRPDYNGKFLSRLEGDTVWNSGPHTVKLRNGRVIDELYPAAPWSRAARSTGRKVTKTPQTASSAASSSAKKRKDFWPKDPRKRKGSKTPLDQYDIHMRAVRGAYNLPRNRNSTDIGPTLKSQLDEYAVFNKRAGRGGPHKLIPRTRYRYGYGMPFDEAPYRNSPSDGLRSKLLQSYAYRHGGYNFHK